MQKAMINANYISTAFLAIASLIFFSCQKEDKPVDKASQIGFAEELIEYDLPWADSSTIELQIPFRIIGNSFDEEEQISVSIKEEGAWGNSSVFPKSQTATIHSDDYTPVLNLTCDPSHFEEGETKKFTLSLADEKDLIASEFSTTELLLAKRSMIDLLTGTFTCRENLYNYDYEVEILKDELAENRVLIENFWNFSAQLQTVSMEVDKATKKINLPSQEFVDKEGNVFDLSGNGSVNSDGQIQLSYTLYSIDADSIYESGNMSFIKLK